METITLWGMRILIAVLILAAGWVLGNRASVAIRKMPRLDETLRGFLSNLARYTIFAVAFITVLTQFGVQTASLIAVLGAAGLAIGLALQGTLGNVAAGVMLLILRPFRIGDEITFGTVKGRVTALGLFVTELEGENGDFIFAPNSTLWNKEIFNHSRGPRSAARPAP